MTWRGRCVPRGVYPDPSTEFTLPAHLCLRQVQAGRRPGSDAEGLPGPSGQPALGAGQGTGRM